MRTVQIGDINNFMNNVFIILVKPQLGQNIGSVARVMKNLNYKNLRIVNPRDGWPNQDVISTAAGADDILTSTRVFDSVSEACNDLNYLFASSARKRDLSIKTLSLVDTISSLDKIKFFRNNFKFGILFGCESSGLSNKDLIAANQLINIPSNSDFSSLNISHAVSLICWEFFKYFNDLNLEDNSKFFQNESPTMKDMDYFYKNLFDKLDNSGFFHSDFMKNSIMKNIKVLFNRAELSSQEIKTLSGIIKSLYEYNKQA